MRERSARTDDGERSVCAPGVEAVGVSDDHAVAVVEHRDTDRRGAERDHRARQNVAAIGTAGGLDSAIRLKMRAQRGESVPSTG